MRCIGADKASKAAMLLDHKVSPPCGGNWRADSSEPIGGVWMKVTSVCQLSLSGGLAASVSSTMISGTSGTCG